MEAISISAGFLSLISSIAVVATVMIFPSMWNKKIYMQMIVMISVYDIITASAVCLGFPHGTLCSIQGSMLFFGYRGAWMFSVFMILQLTHILKHNKVFASFQTLNIACLIVNIMFEFAPLLTNTWYSSAPEYQGRMLCSFDIYEAYFYDWVAACFAGPLNLTVTLLLFGCALLYRRIQDLVQDPQDKNQNSSMTLVYSVVMYPIVMLFSVLPFLFVFFKDLNKSPGRNISNFQAKYVLLEVIYSWTSLQGLFNAVIFFYNSAEARRRWKEWLTIKCPALFPGTKKALATLDLENFTSKEVHLFVADAEDFLNDEAMVRGYNPYPCITLPFFRWFPVFS